MEQFVSVSGIAAPLLRANIDTDLIIPSREMTSLSKADYGEKLLAPWRYLPGEAGQRVENPEFILNQAPFRTAPILVTGANFGSGSSRESAAWAVRQFGFRCVIAPSFGAIFHNNCFRNGVLPVTLAQEDVNEIGEAAKSGTLRLTVDLRTCTVSLPTGRELFFEVPAEERKMLLEGLDAIGLTKKKADEILAFQDADRALRPWIWQSGRAP